MSVADAIVHPELTAATQAIALASNKLLAIEQQGLRLAPLIHASKIARGEATDILNRSAEANGLCEKPRERETVEHVVGMSLNGWPADVAGRESERQRARIAPACGDAAAFLMDVVCCP